MNARASLPVFAVVLAAALAGCAVEPVKLDVVAPRSGDYTVLKTRSIDRALEDRILALDAERVSARDVAEVRSTPRFIELHTAIWQVLRDEVLKGYQQQLAA